MEEKLICPICGNPTRVYMGNARKDRLCAKHADELKANIIKLDEDGNYIECNTVNKRIDSAVSIQSYNKGITISESGSLLKCILCGNEAYPGSHFCSSCYLKYNKQKILISIDKCNDVTIEEKYADGTIYTCKDGHKVRSKSEREIDNYLFEHELLHSYEKEIYVTPDLCIHPDFYLEKNQIFIEHFGYYTDYYKKESMEKLDIYKDMKLTVICTYEEDMSNIESNLDRKLRFCKPNEVNYSR